METHKRVGRPAQNALLVSLLAALGALVPKPASCGGVEGQEKTQPVQAPPGAASAPGNPLLNVLIVPADGSTFLGIAVRPDGAIRVVSSSLGEKSGRLNPEEAAALRDRIGKAFEGKTLDPEYPPDMEEVLKRSDKVHGTKWHVAASVGKQIYKTTVWYYISGFSPGSGGWIGGPIFKWTGPRSVADFLDPVERDLRGRYKFGSFSLSDYFLTDGLLAVLMLHWATNERQEAWVEPRRAFDLFTDWRFRVGASGRYAQGRLTPEEQGELTALFRKFRDVELAGGGGIHLSMQFPDAAATSSQKGASVWTSLPPTFETLHMDVFGAGNKHPEQRTQHGIARVNFVQRLAHWAPNRAPASYRTLSRYVAALYEKYKPTLDEPEKK